MSSLFSDIVALTRRNMLILKRTPDVLIFSTIQPIIFVVLFNAVFGGSITPTGFDSYLDFLVPGVMIQTIMFASINTGVALAQDLESGSLDRFRSLPISRLSILIGRTNADSVRSLIVNTVVVISGLVLGMSTDGGILGILAGLLLAVLFANSIQWGFAFMALQLKSVQSVQAGAFLPTFPLVFAASTFAPVENMPAWIQVFAERQPVTVTINAIRGFFYGNDALEASGASLGTSLLYSLLWIFGLFAFFAAMSVRKFNQN